MALSDNFLFLQWSDRKISRANAYIAETQIYTHFRRFVRNSIKLVYVFFRLYGLTEEIIFSISR